MCKKVHTRVRVVTAAVCGIVAAGCAPETLAAADVQFTGFGVRISDDRVLVFASLRGRACPQLGGLSAAVNGIPMSVRVGGPGTSCSVYGCHDYCQDTQLELQSDPAALAWATSDETLNIEVSDVSGTVSLTATHRKLWARPVALPGAIDLRNFKLRFEPGPAPLDAEGEAPTFRARLGRYPCAAGRTADSREARLTCPEKTKLGPGQTLELEWEPRPQISCSGARCPGSDLYAWPLGAGVYVSRQLSGLEVTRSTPTLTPSLVSSARYAAIWASGPQDAWAVGSGATNIARWDGQSWQFPQGPGIPSTPLNAVWGSGPSDVWLVGQLGAALHWDGARLTAVPLGTTEALASVWGSSPNDVWILGADRLRHFDGNSWRIVSEVAAPGSCPDCAVFGTGPNDVWAVGRPTVGSSASSQHWDGVGWAFEPAAQGTRLWGTSPRDLWLWDPYGSPLHGDGKTWTATPAVDEMLAVTSVWGTGAEEAWALVPSRAGLFVGLRPYLARWNGSAWSWEADLPAACLPDGTCETPEATAISGSGPSDIWVALDNGTILHGP